MAVKRKKTKKGGSIKQAIMASSPATAVYSKLSKSNQKAAKGGAVRGGATGALRAGIVGAIGGAAVGAGAAVLANKFFGKKGKQATSGKGKRRRSPVPKVVKKWATRYASRQKQAAKIIRKVFGSDGSKIVKRPRRFSRGVITASEAREALRE